MQLPNAGSCTHGREAHEQLLGEDEEARTFRTFHAKEHPAEMSSSLLAQGIEQHVRTQLPTQLPECIDEPVWPEEVKPSIVTEAEVWAVAAGTDFAEGATTPADDANSPERQTHAAAVNAAVLEAAPADPEAAAA